jgi:hypothetical protein
MIAYDLCCEKDHTFELWFQDRDSFEDQREKGRLVCPQCGSKNIKKAISPIAVRRNKSFKNKNSMESSLKEAMSRVVEYVEKNTEDVGTDFAKEALKMHYEIKEPKNIRGVATSQEEKMLKDEGINFFRIPVIKKNKPKLN